MAVKQLLPMSWPPVEHRPIAMLYLEAPEMTQSYGLVFDEGFDNLDYNKSAAIELVDGSEVRLIQYPNAPGGGMGTIIFAAIDTDWDHVRELVLQTLQLSQSAYSWVSPLSAAEVRAEVAELVRTRSRLAEGSSAGEASATGGG